MSATAQTDWQRGTVQPFWSAVVMSTTQCPFLAWPIWRLLQFKSSIATDPQYIIGQTTCPQIINGHMPNPCSHVCISYMI